MIIDLVSKLEKFLTEKLMKFIITNYKRRIGTFRVEFVMRMKPGDLEIDQFDSKNKYCRF